jgi:hypothetical protein
VVVAKSRHLLLLEGSLVKLLELANPGHILLSTDTLRSSG